MSRATKIGCVGLFFFVLSLISLFFNVGPLVPTLAVISGTLGVVAAQQDKKIWYLIPLTIAATFCGLFLVTYNIR